MYSHLGYTRNCSVYVGEYTFKKIYIYVYLMYHKLYLVFAIITNNKIYHSECLTLNAVTKTEKY